jgi:hypothetical protein
MNNLNYYIFKKYVNDKNVNFYLEKQYNINKITFIEYLLLKNVSTSDILEKYLSNIKVSITNKKYICNERVFLNENILLDLPLMKWLYFEKFFTQSIDLICNAIEMNNYDLILFLEKDLIDKHNIYCILACKNNNFKMLQFLNSKGFPLCSECCYKACENGNLEMLRWLKKKKCKFNINQCCNISAMKNHLNIFIWLKYHKSFFHLF